MATVPLAWLPVEEQGIAVPKGAQVAEQRTVRPGRTREGPGVLQVQREAAVLPVGPVRSLQAAVGWVAR